MTNPRHGFWAAIFLLALVWLFALLFGGRESAWDIALYRELYVGGGTTLARNAAIFTRIGSGLFLMPLGVGAAIYLAFRRKRRTALLLIMIFGGRFLVELQKVLIARPRPGISPHLEVVNSPAFPGGHAANAMITYLAIALLLPVRQRNRAIAVGIALALVIQVGFSRVMLGVHWPSDVLGGWAFGAIWVMVCMWLANARRDVEPNPPPR
jgi:undecaprenyl-diphosphatase